MEIFLHRHLPDFPSLPAWAQNRTSAGGAAAHPWLGKAKGFLCHRTEPAELPIIYIHWPFLLSQLGLPEAREGLMNH